MKLYHSYMGVHSLSGMIENFLSFEHDVLFVKNGIIYADGLLYEIKDIYYKYPYTTLVLDFYPKKRK